jgi:hypothetical protein
LEIHEKVEGIIEGDSLSREQHVPVITAGMLPTRLQHTVEISRPIDEVFVFVADPRNDPQWCPRVIQCAQRKGDGPVAGARYECVHHPTLQRPHSRWIDMVEIEHGRRVRTRQEDNIAVFTIDYFFDATSNGTRVSQCDEIRWKGTPVHRLVGTRIIRRHMRDQLESLKRLLETEPPPALHST